MVMMAVAAVEDIDYANYDVHGGVDDDDGGA